MKDRRDYILDIRGLTPPGSPDGTSGDSADRSRSTSKGSSVRMPTRPWIAITWRCCSVYSRVYRNEEGTAYEGRCPKCAKAVRLRVGPGGTSERFFEAY